MAAKQPHSTKKPTKYRWPIDKKGAKPAHTIPWATHQSNMRQALGPTPSGEPAGEANAREKTVNAFGQMITFSVESGGDFRFSGYTTVTVSKGNDTVRKICKNRGHLDAIKRVLSLNKVKSADTVLTINRRIRVPDRLRRSQVVNVLAGDSAPRITGGYAKIGVIDRTERAGVSFFQGYDPITIEIPVRFESEDRTGSWLGADGAAIERDIGLLEMMVGRGIVAGAAVGAPPIIRLMVRTNAADFVALIPKAYQWTLGNPNNKLWWISDISWDDEAQRNAQGERIRQLATITVTEYVRPDTLSPSAAERVKATTKKPKKKPAKHTTKKK
jgi:hypothetical protein